MKYHEFHHLNAQMSGGENDGCPALHLAIQGGNVEAIQRLLEEDADTSILDKRGESAYDKVKMRWRNQARFMGHLSSKLWKQARASHERSRL